MIPTYADIPILLTWFFLTISSFRVTRFITTDDLTTPLRARADKRFGPTSLFATLINCNWCTGIYITAAVYVEHYSFSFVPLIVHMALATSAVIGYLGNYDD